MGVGVGGTVMGTKGIVCRVVTATDNVFCR